MSYAVNGFNTQENKKVERVDKLVSSIHTKRKCSKTCNKCNGTIEIGDQYTVVKYDDGFISKVYGVYHNECWEEIKNI